MVKGSAQLRAPGSLFIQRIDFGFFSGSVCFGFPFVGIQLRLLGHFVGLDVCFVDSGVGIRLFDGGFSGGIDGVFLFVDGIFRSVFVGIHGSLLFVAGNEDGGREREEKQSEVFHIYLWVC